MEREEDIVDKLAEKVSILSQHIEKMRISEYVELLSNPRRLFMMNFLVGIVRGLGVGIGMTILAAILLYVLSKMVTLPLIGQYIAEIIKIVQSQLGVVGGFD